MIKIHTTIGIINGTVPKRVKKTTITLFGIIPIYKVIFEQEAIQIQSEEEEEEIPTQVRKIGFNSKPVQVEDEPNDNI